MREGVHPVIAVYVVVFWGAGWARWGKNWYAGWDQAAHTWSVHVGKGQAGGRQRQASDTGAAPFRGKRSDGHPEMKINFVKPVHRS